jgi:hypothetical protein
MVGFFEYVYEHSGSVKAGSVISSVTVDYSRNILQE